MIIGLGSSPDQTRQINRLLAGRSFDEAQDDAPAMVSEHNEYEEDAQARRGHREEIEGDHIPEVVGEERSPGLRRPRTPLRHQPGDGALGDADAELQEFAVDSRGTPEGVRRGHSDDQSLDLSVNLRATSVRAV